MAALTMQVDHHPELPDDAPDGEPSLLSVPMRKRTVRACDQCRRRKTKCDGLRPCATCSSIGLDCSYGSRIKQARGPTYVVHLERKVEELQNQVKEASEPRTKPQDGYDDAAAVSPESSGALASSVDRPQYSRRESSYKLDVKTDFTAASYSSSDNASPYEVDDMEYIDTIRWPRGRRDSAAAVPYGKATGLEVVRRMRSLCGEFAGLPPDSEEDAIAKLVLALDCPMSISKLSTSLGNVMLPSQVEVVRLVDIAFHEAFCLWPFVERAAVDATIHHFYQGAMSLANTGHQDELALLMGLVALGQRLDVTTMGALHELPAIPSSHDPAGLRFLVAATTFVDTANCGRSLVALQAILCFSLYAKSVNCLSLCHSYTSAAAGAALRMGLHESPVDEVPQDRALKLRVWSTVRAFDTISTSLLGIPSQIQLHHVPNIADERYPPLGDSRSNIELIASNSHSKLSDILGRIVDLCYRSTADAYRRNGFYGIELRSLRQVGAQLLAWAQKYSTAVYIPLENLPRAQLMLELAYEHARILLYSPFMHYAVPATPGGTLSAAVPAEFACSAILAAKRLVRVMQALELHGDLNPAHPLVVHALAFAAVVLLLAELSSMDRLDALTQRDFQAATDAARGLLERLALRSDAAASCLESLTPLFDAPTRAYPFGRSMSFDAGLMHDPSMYYLSMATSIAGVPAPGVATGDGLATYPGWVGTTDVDQAAYALDMPDGTV